MENGVNEWEERAEDALVESGLECMLNCDRKQCRERDGSSGELRRVRRKERRGMGLE